MLTPLDLNQRNYNSVSGIELHCRKLHNFQSSHICHITQTPCDPVVNLLQCLYFPNNPLYFTFYQFFTYLLLSICFLPLEDIHLPALRQVYMSSMLGLVSTVISWCILQNTLIIKPWIGVIAYDNKCLQLKTASRNLVNNFDFLSSPLVALSLQEFFSCI